MVVVPQVAWRRVVASFLNSLRVVAFDPCFVAPYSSLQYVLANSSKARARFCDAGVSPGDRTFAAQCLGSPWGHLGNQEAFRAPWEDPQVSQALKFGFGSRQPKSEAFSKAWSLVFKVWRPNIPQSSSKGSLARKSTMGLEVSPKPFKWPS